MTRVFIRIAATVWAIIVTIMTVLYFIIATETTPFNVWFTVGILSVFTGISWRVCFAILSEAH
jgi:hypothetical protein